MRVLFFLLFLVGGVVIALATYGTIMMGVWGRPVHYVEYVAFFSSVLLLVSTFVSLFKLSAGRLLGIVSLLGIGGLSIPASVSLLPSPNTLISPVNYALFAGYFAILGLALFCPHCWRWSLPLFGCCLLGSLAFAGSTYIHRARRGEIEFPKFVSFELKPSSDSLHAEYDPDHCLTPDIQNLLATNGITGTLEWCSGNAASGRRLIVVCSSRTRSDKDLPHPKSGAVVYLFDGADWRTFPAGASVYPVHATLKPDGMLCQRLVVGGMQCSPAFIKWQNTGGKP